MTKPGGSVQKAFGTMIKKLEEIIDLLRDILLVLIYITKEGKNGRGFHKDGQN